MTVTTAARYQRTFHGRADQVPVVRHKVATYLAGCPVADDMVLLVSEITTNAVLHSLSAGAWFTVRAELHDGYAWLEVQDLGGDWHCRQPGDSDGGRGLLIVEAVAGDGNWGVEMIPDGRIVWVRLPW